MKENCSSRANVYFMIGNTVNNAHEVLYFKQVGIRYRKRGKKRVKFRIAKTYDEFSLQFCRDIKPYKRKWRLTFTSELVGKLQGRRVYLQKTKPLFTNYASRRFVGEIQENDMGITLEGQIKSPLISEFVLSIFLLPLPFLETIQNMGNIKESIPYFLILLGFAIFIIATHYLNNWLNKNEERAVIEYLENLARENNDTKS